MMMHVRKHKLMDDPLIIAVDVGACQSLSRAESNHSST